MKIKEIKATKSILINTGNYENVRFEYELTSEWDNKTPPNDIHNELTKHLNYMIRKDLHDMIMNNNNFHGDKNEWLKAKYAIYGLNDEND